MPRRKQDKPQHLEEDSQVGQVMNSEQTSGNTATTSAHKKPEVTKQNSTASTENSDRDMDVKQAENELASNDCLESSSSAGDLSLDGPDSAVITSGEWMSVKATLSSLQQQMQMLRLQQFQIMQLLTSKSQNISNNNSSSTGTTAPKNPMISENVKSKTDMKEQIGEETADPEDISKSSDADTMQINEGKEIQEEMEIRKPETEMESEEAPDEKEVNQSVESSERNEQPLPDVEDDEEDLDDDFDDGEDQPSFECDVCSAVLPTPEMLKLHQLGHASSSASSINQQDTDKTIPSNPFLNSFNGSNTTSAGSSSHNSLPPSYHSVISDFTNDDSLEEFMEILKPENTHLEQLAKNLDGSVTDPNQCLICKRVLSCKSALMMHYRTHTGERPFRCKLCSRAFTTKGNLKTHMGVHRAKPPMRLLHSCTVCNKQFTNALVLNQHLKMHSDEAVRKRDLDGSNLIEDNKRPKFSNDIKNELMEPFKDKTKPSDQFNSLSTSLGFPFDMGMVPSMQGHLRYAEAFARQWEQLHQFSMFNPLAVSSPANMFLPGLSLAAANGSFRLPLLDQTNSASPSQNKTTPNNNTQDLLVSIPTSKANRPEISNDNQTSISDEKTTPNSSEQPNQVSSPKSDKSWESSGTNSTTPSMRVDPPPGTTCDICSKAFACRSALEIHYRSHTKQRPFKCEICDKAFTTRGNMKQHVLTHKSDEIQMANHERLSRSLGSSPSGVSLERILSGEEARKSNSNHQCSICYKHFSSASAVQIHFRTHTGDRPFKCTVCGKAFTTKGNLKVHMGTHMWTSQPNRRGRLSADGPEANDCSSISESAPVTPTTNGINNNLEWSSLMKTGLLGNTAAGLMANYPAFFMNSGAPSLQEELKPWLWQVTCHICNKECQSPAALELHVKTHVTHEASNKPVTA